MTINSSYIYKQKEVLFLIFFVILVLLIVSPDSFTHDLFNRQDSAWFFMSGKAWMNGLTPYVDFTDSKGPLLWLIFGIAYLLSTTTYLGLFWISCLFYAFTYIYTYKTANLFLNNSRLALLTILILSLSFFNYWIHYEFRAEDCCQPFIAIVLYRLCLTIYRNGIENKSLHSTNFLLGACFMILLLIKYTLALMLGPAYLYYLYFLIRNKTNITHSLSEMVVGSLTIALPFIIYFIIKGNLFDFLNEYFLNTFLTVQGANSSSIIINEILSILCVLYAERLILLVITIVGCIQFARHSEKDKFFPLIMFSGFYFLSLHHAFGNYYFCSCLIFPVFFCIDISKRLEGMTKRFGRRFILTTSFFILIFLTVFNFTTKHGFIIRNAFFYDNQERTDYYNVAYLMAQIHKPKIIYLESQEYGYGTPADALPGCKYWSSQLGATPAMQAEQLASIEKADFIITDHRTPNYNRNFSILQEAGFRKYYSYEHTDISFEVFSKHHLQMPPNDFHVSNSDVLFKRKVLQLK